MMCNGLLSFLPQVNSPFKGALPWQPEVLHGHTI